MKIRENNLLMQEIDGEVVILDSTAGKIFKLNPVSCYVWQRLNEKYTIDSIIEGICESFTGCERTEVAQDVQRCIEQFRELGLIVADT
jgi:Coenzyme PQQ synthesis protein D (PqqD)